MMLKRFLTVVKYKELHDTTGRYSQNYTSMDKNDKSILFEGALHITGY